MGGAAPLCAECGDREPEAEFPCEECPRCAHCEERLADRPAFALQPVGWDAWCSAACLQDDAEHWSRPARAALALALLDTLGNGALAEHPQRSELLGFCHEELSGALRALLVRPRASERVARESLRWNPSELALLAGEGSKDSVVERFCPECDSPVERFIDPATPSAPPSAALDENPKREAGLCDWHAHVEALRILQRRQPARGVRPDSEHAHPAANETLPSRPARSA